MAAVRREGLNLARVLALSWSIFSRRGVAFSGLLLIAGLLAGIAIGLLYMGFGAEEIAAAFD